MMLLESPWPILWIAIPIALALLFMFLRNGQGRFLLIFLGVAAIAALGLLVEFFVVTQREELENTIYACAAAIKANNMERLLENVAPGAKHARNDAAKVLGRFEFRDAYFADLEVKVDSGASPPTATAKFMGYVRVRDRTGQIPYESAARRVTVNFRKQNGRWLVTDYDREAALGGW